MTERKKTQTERLPEANTNDTKRILDDAREAKSPTKRIAEQHGIEVELLLAPGQSGVNFQPQSNLPQWCRWVDATDAAGGTGPQPQDPLLSEYKKADTKS